MSELMCFVAHPFDNGGEFDKRYESSIEPAINKAGFKAFRVDKDVSKANILENLYQKIKNSDVLLIDISADNPNVWLEFGYAKALNKEICLISSDRKLPFDITHDLVAFYKKEAKQDFDELEEKIEKRLKAIYTNLKLIKKPHPEIIFKSSDKQIIKESHLYILEILSSEGLSGSFYEHVILKKMNNYGYSAVETSLALRELLKSKIVEKIDLENFNGEPFNNFAITENGWDYMQEYQHNFISKKQPVIQKQVGRRDQDDDIPF